MNFIAWTLYFLFMPLWALTTLYFTLFFSLIYNILKFTAKTVLLIMKGVKIGIRYAVRKVREHRQ